MIIGYARVSTTDQNCDYQIDELTKSGCEKIFVEKASAKTKDRPELTRLLDSLRQDDIVVVYKLDRLGRSLKDLITLLEMFKSNGVQFKSLYENIDTTTLQIKRTTHHQRNKLGSSLYGCGFPIQSIHLEAQLVSEGFLKGYG